MLYDQIQRPSTLDELVMINAVVDKYNENKEWFKKISSSFFNKGRAQSIYLNDHFEYIQLADYKTDQQSDKIYFKDVKFREKLKNELTKRNLL